MAWSYSGNPTDSYRDQVRFLIGDTDDEAQLIQDEEIDWSLVENTSVYLAAATVALSIAAQYARKVDFSVGKDLQVSYKNQANFYSKLAKDLSKRASFSFSTPYSGGISISDKDGYKNDVDRVKPMFTKNDCMDNTDFGD